MARRYRRNDFAETGPAVTPDEQVRSHHRITRTKQGMDLWHWLVALSPVTLEPGGRTDHTDRMQIEVNVAWKKSSGGRSSAKLAMSSTTFVNLPAFLTAPLYRRWHLRWGATPAEAAASLPGDALLPRAQYKSTRAITINAPPEAVWPWLVQVGCQRAGFYSNDLLDNLGHPS
jgi:hypothetical protein